MYTKLIQSVSWLVEYNPSPYMYPFLSLHVIEFALIITVCQSTNSYKRTVFDIIPQLNTLDGRLLNVQL